MQFARLPVRHKLRSIAASTVDLPAIVRYFAAMRPLWTVEQAREMGRRSAEAKKQRKLNPPPDPPAVIRPTKPEPLPADDYQTEQLKRVRSHIETLHDKLEACDDPMDIDRLARALNTLLDRARILSGVPLLKPAVVPRSKPSASFSEPT